MRSTLKEDNMDPTIEEMRQFLETCAGPYDADDADIEEAIYWYAAHNHGGQTSNLYSALSQSQFKPGPLACDVSEEGVSGFLYEELEYKFGAEVYS